MIKIRLWLIISRVITIFAKHLFLIVDTHVSVLKLSLSLRMEIIAAIFLDIGKQKKKQDEFFIH